MFKKKTLYWLIVAGIAYFFLNYHIIMVGKSFRLLKKSRITMEYTFFSTQGKTNKNIISIDDLRNDGIGDILLEMGKIGEHELIGLMRKYQIGDD